MFEDVETVEGVKMAIDWSRIGITPERIYRPYLWSGEDHDRHVQDYRPVSANGLQQLNALGDMTRSLRELSAALRPILAFKTDDGSGVWVTWRK